MGDIYPLTAIWRPIDLAPIFGSLMDQCLSCNNSLVIATTFYLNNFGDKETFLTYISVVYLHPAFFLLLVILPVFCRYYVFAIDSKNMPLILLIRFHSLKVYSKRVSRPTRSAGRLLLRSRTLFIVSSHP